MIAMKPYVSRDFQRPLVPIKFFAQWKACTFRDFALYFAFLLLKPFLSSRVYETFLKYCVGIRILRTRSCSTNSTMLDLAETLLREFSNEYDDIVGYRDTVYSVHNLIHLTSDVRVTKLPLDELSTYSFENSYRPLRDRVKSSSTPIAQIEKRLHEVDRYYKMYKIYHESPLLEKSKNGKVTKFKLYYSSFVADSLNDSFCKIDDCIVQISSVNGENSDCKLSGRVYAIEKPFFVSPIDSSLLEIFVIKATHRVITSPINRISCKLYVLPYLDKLVSFPAVHSI
ncbi:uncharacterized protein LOC135944194 [Cloeon dipterum]|uniref:uncharacterized protein LOC135944194 n=1 Tax=Cloeon dipterum TaxID=197152 RepID=UPI00321FA6C8